MMKFDKNTKTLLLFFVFTYLLHIAAGLLCRAVPVVFLQILLPWTPNITAILLIIFYLKDQSGVRRLVNGWKKWRANPKWYLLAFSPLVVYFLSAGIYFLFGGIPPGPDPVPFLGFSFPVMAVIAVFTGATGEELGWRGFALPRLQRRFSALISSLILGFYWGIWHIPSWIISGSPFTIESTIFFIATTILNSIIITCIYNNTKGSIFLVSIHHWSENVWSQYVVSYLGLISWEALGWIRTPITGVIAIFLIIFLGSERLSTGEVI
jgi:membrane protease YdiL (CAAX protease family)